MIALRDAKRCPAVGVFTMFDDALTTAITRQLTTTIAEPRCTVTIHGASSWATTREPSQPA